MKVLWYEVFGAYEASSDKYPSDEVTEVDLRDMFKKFSNKVDELINRVNEPEPELEDSQR